MTIADIGEVLAWGEYWLLIYGGCGHETYFNPTAHRLFEPAVVEAEVRRYYAECQACSHPLVRPAPN